jgi:hypothetical protein
MTIGSGWTERPTSNEFARILDHEAGWLRETMHEFREERAARVHRIAERLAALGMPIDPAEVLALVREGSAGRPHVAQVMVRRGYVASVKEAFDRYLRAGGPAYVSHRKLTVRDACALIHRAGGVAVMAHPGFNGGAEALIRELAGEGLLDGVECYYAEHTPEQTAGSSASVASWASSTGAPTSTAPPSARPPSPPRRPWAAWGSSAAPAGESPGFSADGARQALAIRHHGGTCGGPDGLSGYYLALSARRPRAVRTPEPLATGRRDVARGPSFLAGDELIERHRMIIVLKPGTQDAEIDDVCRRIEAGAWALSRGEQRTIIGRRRRPLKTCLALEALGRVEAMVPILQPFKGAPRGPPGGQRDPVDGVETGGPPGDHGGPRWVSQLRAVAEASRRGHPPGRAFKLTRPTPSRGS